MPTAPYDRQIGRLVGGRYRLVSLLGAGGMGAVYRAVHTTMAKDFAVKLLRPELSRTMEATRRFEREAEAASRLTHPSCVRVTDFGQDDGTLFLVMERLVGPSLAQVIADQGRLPAARAVHIGEQILEAIAHAHELGVVHRDLKPENVILVAVDGDPDAVKICDFGLARVVGEPGAEAESGSGSGRGPTDPGTVFGTPEYLSPEQALGEQADGRADLYAIGVMLYEMIAGRRPFAGSTRSELLAAHLTREPPRLIEAAPEIPPELEAVVMRALAKRKADRWQTAGELRAALLSVPLPPEAPVFTVAAIGSRPPAIEHPGTAPMETIERPPAVAASQPAPAMPPPVTAEPQQAVAAVAEGTRPVSLGAAGLLSRKQLLYVAAGAGALLLIILIVALASSPARRTVAAPSQAPDLAFDPVRAALRKGDTAAASLGAERLAHDYPQDARAYVLLGDALFADREVERALAAYREAARMNRSLAAAHPELRANLRATYADAKHGEAARALARELGQQVDK